MCHWPLGHRSFLMDTRRGLLNTHSAERRQHFPAITENDTEVFQVLIGQVWT